MNRDLNKSFLPMAQEWVQQCLECWDTVDINQTRFPTYCTINILSPNTPPSPPISRHLHQAPMAPCTLLLTKDVPPGFLSWLMKTHRGRREGEGWGVQVTPRWKAQTPGLVAWWKGSSRAAITKQLAQNYVCRWMDALKCSHLLYCFTLLLSDSVLHSLQWPPKLPV